MVQKNNEKTKKKHHARLPAQVPASSVSKSPDGNNRQERKDAVSGQEDGKHQTIAWSKTGARESNMKSTVFRNVWEKKAMVPWEQNHEV